MKYRSACVIGMFITMHLLSGCVIIDGVSPYQRFLNYYGGYVGKPIQVLKSRGAHTISVKQLPNGNVEEEFWILKGTCRYYYEVDHKTGIIVSWRHEGEQSNCFWAP